MNMKSEEFLANNRRILLGREKADERRYCEKCKVKLDLKAGVSVGASGRISPSSDRFFSKSIINDGQIIASLKGLGLHLPGQSSQRVSLSSMNPTGSHIQRNI